MEKLTIGTEEYRGLAQAARRIDFFSTLTGAQLDALLGRVLFYRYEPREIVFKKGSAADAFYIIHEGQAGVVVRAHPLLFWKKLKLLGPGQVFGEMALLYQEPRSATVMAHSALKLFVFLKDDFLDLVKQNPTFADHIRKLAAVRQFDMSHQS